MIMVKKSILFISVFLGLLVFLLPQSASAQTPDIVERQIEQCAASNGVWDNIAGRCMTQEEAATLGDCGNRTLLGVPTWYKYLESSTVSGKCKPVINSVEDALPIGLAVLEAMLTIGGMVAVAMVFIGGFKYVLSQGEADKAAGGRKTVVNAMIGLVIIILATRVVSFIGNRLG